MKRLIPDRRSVGFTLVEVMMAVMIGVMALAGIAVMMVASVKTFQDVTSMLYLTHRARLTREYVLRGGNRQHGMREATTNISLTTDDSHLRFDAADTSEDDVACELYINPSTGEFRYWRNSWKTLNRPEVRTAPGAFSYDAANRELTCALTSTITRAGTTYTHVQTIRTVVINDE
jgi:type II secretory pathway pseudopilin PulG